MALNEGDAGNGGGDGGQGGGQGGGASAADLLGGAAPTGGGEGGGSGDGNQGGGDGGQGGGSGGDGGGSFPWLDGLSGELGEGEAASNRDYVKAKGFKDLDGLVRAYRHAEKAIHDSGRVAVPGEGASAEEVAAFHKAIGVPDEASGYELAAIKDADGNDVAMNTPLLERLAGTALKAGVPKAAYEALVNDFVQAQLEEVTAANQAEQTEAAAKVKEWGNQAGAKTAAIDRALEHLGINREETLKLRSALGAGRALDLFAKLGEGLAEDAMTRGGPPQKFGVTPTQAQEQLNAMKADRATVDKIFVPGTPEHARYNRLLNIAAGG